MAHDMDKKPEPHLLQSITIRCGEVIDSIAFSYVDHSGNPQTIGPWGGPGGTDSLVSKFSDFNPQSFTSVKENRVDLDQFSVNSN